MFSQQTLATISHAIIERLDIATSQHSSSAPLRCFISGFGCDIFAEELITQLSSEHLKMFFNPPPNYELRITNKVVLDGIFEKKLLSFPPNTFDLIISLWTISPLKPEMTIKIIRRGLKKGGQFGLITSLDGSPRIPLQILNKVIKERPDLGLKLYRTNLPADLSAARKLIEKNGFFNPRVWSESLVHSYPDTNTLFAELVGQGQYQKLAPADQSFIRQRFGELMVKKPDNSISVEFNLAGAAGD